MEHSGHRGCGIPDGDTIVMTGGFDQAENTNQKYVTRFHLLRNQHLRVWIFHFMSHVHG